MKAKLVLVTDNFPFEKGEVAFIGPELAYLKEYFDITIISKCLGENLTTKLPLDITVYRCSGHIALSDVFLYGIETLLKISFWQEIARAHRKGNPIYKSLRVVFSDCIRSEKLYFFMRKILSEYSQQGPILFYSYWYNYAARSLIKLKQNYFMHSKVVTRAHGYDLYNERAALGYQLFREETDKKLDKIIFTCKKAMDYYIANQSTSPIDKYMYSYLGTLDGKLVGTVKENEFILISCSNLIPLKRISKIIDALCLISDFNIRWVHFGDGILKQELMEYAKKMLTGRENISYEFRGHCPTEVIKNYYASNNVDCFILLSETEGLPVSIMEALAYGIPVIGTNVGGIEEEIDGTNGILLPANPSSSEVVEAIKKIHGLDESERNKMRTAAYTTWKTKFDAAKNGKNLSKYLYHLLTDED